MINLTDEGLKDEARRLWDILCDQEVNPVDMLEKALKQVRDAAEKETVEKAANIAYLYKSKPDWEYNRKNNYTGEQIATSIRQMDWGKFGVHPVTVLEAYKKQTRKRVRS